MLKSINSYNFYFIKTTNVVDGEWGDMYYKGDTAGRIHMRIEKFILMNQMMQFRIHQPQLLEMV